MQSVIKIVRAIILLLIISGAVIAVVYADFYDMTPADIIDWLKEELGFNEEET